MASIRYSALVAAAAGSIGSVVLSSSRGGATARTRPKPPIADSAAQLDSRAHFRAVTAAWTALSAANRLTWTTAAATLTTPNRVGFNRPRTAKDLFFSVALPMSYAGVTLPTSFARPTYYQPYTTIRAVPFAGQALYLTMDSAATPSAQGFIVRAGRTFSNLATAPKPPLRHILTSTTVQCYLDIYQPFKDHFGEPQAGEYLWFEVSHFQPGGWQRSTFTFSTPVLSRGAAINPNGTFEGSWSGNTPASWTPSAGATYLRRTVNPLADANSWTVTVPDSAATEGPYCYLGYTINTSKTYEFRALVSITAGHLDHFVIAPFAGTQFDIPAPIAAPWQGQITIPIDPSGWTNPCGMYPANNPHSTGSWTVDNVSIREVL